MRHSLRRTGLALAIATLIVGTAAHADVTLNLKDAEINTLISTVSEVTGKNFIVDPRVKGKVTVISATPMDKRAVYETFLAVLQVQGFAAVPAGNAIKIIPETNARTDAGMKSGDGVGRPIDDVVTHVYALQNVSAAQLVPILRPLIPQWGHLAAYPGNNMLIISDRAGNVARMEEIIRRLDNGGDRDVESITLENASAAEVVRVISSLLQQGKQADPTMSVPTVIADERANAVLVGGDKAERVRIAELIKKLDSPVKDDGATQVVYLRYASAENLAPILEGYAQNVGDAAKGSSTAGATASAPLSGAGGGSERTRVLADKDTNALVITAAPKAMRQIRNVVQQLDIQRAQVLVEAIVAEVSASKSSQLGLNFAAYNPNGGAIASILDEGVFKGLASAAASVATGGSAVAGLSALGQGVNIGGAVIRNDGRSGTSFGVLLKALQGDGDTNVLSTPSLVSLDNEESQVSVGQEVPYVTGSFTNTGNSTTSGAVNPFQTVERKDVGLKLGVTPQINEGNTVKLKIKLESSSVASGSAGTSNLVTNKRTITNTVNVESGQVLVIGGLIDDNLNDSASGVPYLSQIPGLGALFRYRSVSKNKRNLMVFIHPTILRSQADGDYYTRRKYDDLRVQQMSNAPKRVPLIGGTRPALQALDDYLRDSSLPAAAPAPAPAATPVPVEPTLTPTPVPQPTPVSQATPPASTASSTASPTDASASPKALRREGMPANTFVVPGQTPSS